ncbi:AarF/UbiB family protein, partial [bacterium]|nr:AarF/UbiB family protein [bacterium]
MAFIKHIETMGRRMKDLQRFREIVRVFIKYGYDDLAQKLHIPSVLGLPIKNIIDTSDHATGTLSQPAKLRRICEELGPTFIKLGQILSTRPNLLTHDYIVELSQLHNQVPALPFDEIQTILQKELKTNPETIFRSIDPIPLGAASMAQVHQAKLQDGKQVVIKIQRPGISKTIEQDLEILEYFAHLMEHHLESWRTHQPSRIVEEFASHLSKELDFTLEASHI